MDNNLANKPQKLSDAIAPDCALCGKHLPVRAGSLCNACHALKVRGYRLDTENISGAVRFLAMDTAHFYSGYYACESDMLKEIAG